MHNAYPLLVDQNGWGLGRPTWGERDPAATSALLRSIGAELSRSFPYSGGESPPPPQERRSHCQQRRDLEIYLELPPPRASLTQEYPQPIPDGYPPGGRYHPSRYGHERHIRKSSYPLESIHQNQGHNSPYRVRSSTGRSHRPPPRLNLDLRPVHVQVETHHPMPSRAPRSPNPRGVPVVSPRTSPILHPNTHEYDRNYTRSRHEDVDATASTSLLHNYNWATNDHCEATDSESYRMVSYPLRSVHNRSEVSLCCSPRDYYYGERLRQEPEPGLCKCCDYKISCCFCFPCCDQWCPRGHMNSVCTSLICFGVMVFIVLSPLFHYLVKPRNS